MLILLNKRRKIMKIQDKIQNLFAQAKCKVNTFRNDHAAQIKKVEEKTIAVAKVALSLVAIAFTAFCLISAAPLLFKAAVLLCGAAIGYAAYKKITEGKSPVQILGLEKQYADLKVRLGINA